MTVNIHGKEYVTVAERITEAHASGNLLSITTEVLYQDPVTIKATITTKQGIFTGISAANISKAIEKQSPYEVAETSAVGRALGFAGFGAVDGIATAEEMVKAAGFPIAPQATVKPVQATGPINTTSGPCPVCHAPQNKPHSTTCATLKG